MSRGGKRGRRRARDRKYSMGVDLAADGSVDASVMGYWRDGVYHVLSVGIRGKDFTGVFYDEFPTVIEGHAVPVEKRPERLLDAGGSEP